MDESFDVIIVGGGVVGLATALALSQKTSLQIAVLDLKKITSSWSINQISARVSAISPLSKNIFKNLNVWSRIESKRFSAYKKIYVWDNKADSHISFDSNDVHADALGYIVEDNVMGDSLLEELNLRTNVTLFSSMQLQDIKKNPDESWEIVADTNKNFKTKLVIAADGANSWVRGKLGIALQCCAYHHDALVTTVQTELQHNATARQRFLPSGPLAFLPLANPHLCSIVWSAPPTEISKLLTCSVEEFTQQLQSAFEDELGVIETIEKRYSFSLTMRHAKNYVQAGLALIGDAAHTIHPLAGQGVNMGLLDVACLVDVICDALQKRRQFYSLITLRKYERARKTDNALLLTVVEGLKKIFENNAKPIKSFRQLGMTLADHSQTLKNFFVRFAMGDRCDSILVRK